MPFLSQFADGAAYSVVQALINNLVTIANSTGWADYADTEFTVSNPFIPTTNVDTELPINAQAGPRSQLPEDVADFFIASHLDVTNISGTFQPGETVTGGTSGDTAVITEVTGSQLFLEEIGGDFSDGETITGGTSGATATANGAREPGKITGRNNDGLHILVNFKVKPTSGATTRIDCWIDIGGAVGELYRRPTLYSR